MKKIIFILLALVLFVPIPMQLKDGGTVVYKAITYEVRDVHSLTSAEEAENGKEYNEGIIVKIFGMEVFNNVK